MKPHPTWKQSVMKKYILPFAILALCAMISFSCSKDAAATTTTNTGTGTTTATVPDVFKKFNSTVTISSDGTYITIKSDGIPDHKSCYFSTGDSRYQAYNGSNTAFSKNPNS